MTLDVNNVKFSFWFTSKYKAIWKENLVVNQMSFRHFFHTPLRLNLSFKWDNIQQSYRLYLPTFFPNQRHEIFNLLSVDMFKDDQTIIF